MGGKTKQATGLALLLATGMAWAGGALGGKGNLGLIPNDLNIQTRIFIDVIMT